MLSSLEIEPGHKETVTHFRYHLASRDSPGVHTLRCAVRVGKPDGEGSRVVRFDVVLRGEEDDTVLESRRATILSKDACAFVRVRALKGCFPGVTFGAHYRYRYRGSAASARAPPCIVLTATSQPPCDVTKTGFVEV